MGLAIASSCENGERFIVSPPFAGYPGDWATLDIREYCSLMHAYYAAIEAVGGAKSGCHGRCCRDAVGIGRSRFEWSSSGEIANVGGDSASGGCGDRAQGSIGENVSGGLVDASSPGSDGSCAGTRPVSGGAVVSGDVSIPRGCGSEFRDVSGSRGPNYERNRANRAAKKARKCYKGPHVKTETKIAINDQSELQSAFGLCNENTRKELAESRARRYIAENEQAVLRAQRQLKVLEASDVDAEIRRRRVAVTAATERSMVSIEKTHSILVANGDIPGEMTGFAATIASGSITPNSSVSEAEVRRCQRALADAKKEIDDLKLTRAEAVREGYVQGHDPDIWTVNSKNEAILDEMYPEGYGEQSMSIYGMSGKIRVT